MRSSDVQTLFPMLLATLTRARRAVLATAVTLTFLLLLSWLVLPWWLRGIAEAQASQALGRNVSIGSMSFNPLTLTVGVDDVEIAGPGPGSRPLLRLAHGEVNADLRSLWRRAPVVQAVELRAPELSLARQGDGRYDIDDLLARFKPEPSAAPSAPPRFALYNLRVTEGHIRFDDQPRQRVHEVKALQLGLPFLSNLDDAVDVLVQPHLAFELDDTRFDTGAQATPFAAERAGSLTLKTGDIDLADWLPYLPADLPVRPTAGTVSLDVALEFKVPANAAPQVGLKGSLRAKGLRLADSHDATWAQLGGLALQLTDAQPLRRQLTFGAVELDGLDVHAWRDRQGRLNGMDAAAAPASPADTAVSTPWQLGIARLTVKDGRAQWQDDAVLPAARLGVEALQLQLDDLRWPLAATGPAAHLAAEARLVPGGSAQASGAQAPGWRMRGEWGGSGGSLQAQGSAWPLGSAAPYLAAVLTPRLEGRLGFDATLRWTGPPDAAVPTLQVSDLTVDQFAARQPGERAAALEWKQLRLGGLQLDIAQRQATLARLEWQQPVLNARRDAAGDVDVLQWWRGTAAPSAGAAPAAEAPPPWRLQLQQAALDGGRLAWHDAATGAPEPVSLEVQGLKLDVHDLAWPAAAKAVSRLRASARLVVGDGSAGTLSWQGDIGLAPVSWRGTARIERFPLHAVMPYAAAALPVTLSRAEAGWVGQVAGGVTEAGLSLAMKGDGRLTELRLDPRPAGATSRGDELLSWQSLELPGVDVAVSPGQRPRLALGEARLSDFYARLLVNEAGHFNLADLNAASQAATPAGAAAASAPASSVPGAGSPVPAPATPGAPASAPAFDLSVAGVQLANGRVDFSDHFVRPNYSAALSGLSGRVGAFRTGTREMAPVELRGQVAGTAQLELRGQINPTAKPLALDLQARASELELAPLSPYAGKYAGYAIERGKLTMDVSYRIDADGRLDAKNQIVLNQLSFGERIDSPDATRLPVLLAVALLKDRNGVIDLNLPVGGSLNDPEFSIGGVVLKLIANLLTKALTAPFALLSGGGSEDLSLVEFEPGTARLAPSAGPVLDKVAHSLAERPALQMTVSGAADPQSERGAMQSAWLDDRLAAEWRKERLRTGTPADVASALPAAWSPEDRARLVRRLYGDSKLPTKPRNVLGLAKDIPVPEMEALLRASYLVSVDQARELALQRGLAVRDALVAKGLPSERLFLAAPTLRASGEDDAHWMPRVQLSLAMH
jgi:uncharacterized protein involved in outer membrane biogenesis